ncbi:cytosine permease [Arsenophonus nasoniae]|uniref:Cytosine permease n=2 Tax=Arsenophonus nasoniae TaxID=638 RepID=A0A4P7KP91_9GAMM|nr:cytosine permease [Arsenophonus nasoniae]QBY41757.1 Cytosine permease [Arsenophonus nasoniae]WGM05940.1 cytosine permease [Arsenophonus nasoniae]WGM10950.1 cytosine permease [Arsenophonus nasoniae]WGM15653.1 cytosine permease [Arsenophonus nasoniae]
MDKEHSLERIPPLARSDLFSVVLIRIGANTSLSQFILGATLGHAMTFWQAMLATLLGSLILEFIGLGLGLIGCREGLPTSMLSRWCGFGRIGSAMIGFAIAISSLGWFGVQNGVCAKALEYALNGKLDFGWCATISGLFITVLVAFGFKGLSLTAKIAVPLFFAVMIWVTFNTLTAMDIQALINIIPAEKDTMTLSAGATMVAGGCIVAMLTTPDISRYCQTSKDVFWMLTISIIVGEFIVNGVSILIAKAMGTDDVVNILIQNAGWIGVICTILAVIKINDINLYCVSLSMSNVIESITGKKINYVTLTLIAGSIGTFFTVIGILDNFVEFLIIAGVIFPPIAGIMLTDYYILRTNRDLLDSTREEGKLPNNAATPLINYTSLIAWALGSIAGMTMTMGIPSVNSIFISAVIYFCLSILKRFFNKIPREIKNDQGFNSSDGRNFR